MAICGKCAFCKKAQVYSKNLSATQKSRVQAKLRGMAKSHPHIPECQRYYMAVAETAGKA